MKSGRNYRSLLQRANLESEVKAMSKTVSSLEIQEIMDYLPHRYPFLLVDRILEYEENRRIVGIKNVTINEPYFGGHS